MSKAVSNLKNLVKSVTSGQSIHSVSGPLPVHPRIIAGGGKDQISGVLCIWGIETVKLRSGDRISQRVHRMEVGCRWISNLLEKTIYQSHYISIPCGCLCY